MHLIFCFKLSPYCLYRTISVCYLYVLPSTILQSPDSETSTDCNDDDYNGWLEEARYHLRQQRDCLHKAQEAQSKRWWHIVSHYAKQAQLHKQQMKMADTNAAKILVQNRCDLENREISTLDISMTSNMNGLNNNAE